MAQAEHEKDGKSANAAGGGQCQPRPLAAVERSERVQATAIMQPANQPGGGDKKAQGGSDQRRHRLGNDAPPRPARAPDNGHAKQLRVNAPGVRFHNSLQPMGAGMIRLLPSPVAAPLYANRVQIAPPFRILAPFPQPEPSHDPNHQP